MNKLITFEGVDGSGKSTQIEFLKNKFDQLDIQYLSIREPGSTVISENIREILLDNKNSQLCSEAESLLFMAARAQITSEAIIPTLEDGKFVICDRYIDSTIAYQGYGRGLDIPFLKSINNYATRGNIPGLTFILDIDYELSLHRRNREENDRMESGGGDFMNKVKGGYHQIANEGERYKVINGDKPPKEVFKSVWQIIVNSYGDMNDQ